MRRVSRKFGWNRHRVDLLLHLRYASNSDLERVSLYINSRTKLDWLCSCKIYRHIVQVRNCFPTNLEEEVRSKLEMLMLRGTGRPSRASLISMVSLAGLYSIPAECPFFNLASSSSTLKELFIARSTCKLTRKRSTSLGSRVSGSGPVRSMSSSTVLESAKEEIDLVPSRHAELLTAVPDSYDGVIVEMKDPMIPQDFVAALRASVLQWREQGKKGVWIKLPLELSDLVAPAVKEGFRYHHAEPNYLMLVSWLPNTPDPIPMNASHRVGISAFVLNDNKEVLVVQEKNGAFRGKGVWKMPTGVVDEGEDICTAAVREVQEETGIESEFLEILAFRQSHRSFFGKSDLMFVCMLRPKTYVIHKQNSELEAAQWMPIEDYVEQPYNKQHQIFNYVAELCKTKSERAYTGFSALPLLSGSGKNVYLYLNNQDFQQKD